MESRFVSACSVDFVADVDGFGWGFADEFEDFDSFFEAQFAGFGSESADAREMGSPCQMVLTLTLIYLFISLRERLFLGTCLAKW